MKQLLTDGFEPLEETAGGDIRTVAGLELVGQRILRGLFTQPERAPRSETVGETAEILHRPTWGAGLKRYQNEVPTVGRLQQLARDVEDFLTSLPFVDDHSVRVSKTVKGEFQVAITVDVDGESLTLPEVIIA